VLAVTPSNRKRKTPENTPKSSEKTSEQSLWSNGSVGAGAGHTDGTRLIDLTQASRNRTRSSPSSNNLTSRILNSGSPSVTKKAKLSDQISIEEEKGEEKEEIEEEVKENGIADEDEEGDEGGREEGNVELEDATAIEGVDRGDEGMEDGRGECEDISAVEGADMSVENTRDADRSDCAALPDYSLPAISTTDSAPVPLPLPVTTTDTVTSSVPLSVPVPVPVPARSLEEPPKKIDEQKAVTSTSDAVQDRTDAENTGAHAPDSPDDANNGSDDDSDDERNGGPRYEHPFATNGKDGKDTAKICRRHFAPWPHPVKKQTKPIKKTKNGSASSDLASATTSSSTSDKGSLSASELQEQKQLTAQLSFMIARQK
jgi:hypothetical protein